MITRPRAALTAAVFVLAMGPCAAVSSAQGDSKPIEVEVRLMGWAVVSESGSVPAQDETIRDFLVRRARVVVQGHLGESFTATLQFGQDNIGAKVLEPNESISIKDAYLNYRAADAFQIAAGQFKVPFLRANLESGFNQVLVDRGSLPSLRPAVEGSRDLGAMAWGNVDALQYRVALFDGSDQELENGSSDIRVSARAAYNWFTSERELGYPGTYLGTRRVLQVAGQIDLQNSRLDSRDASARALLPRDYRAYALEAFFEQPFAGAWAVTIDGAWLEREDDYLDPATHTRHLDGYYLQPALLFPGHVGPGRIQIAFRREAWDSDTGGGAIATTRTTAGASYFLDGHRRKLQADYTRKHENPEIDNNEFRLSVILVF